MILLRQRNYTDYDIVGDSSKIHNAVSNNKRVKRSAALVGLKKRFNQGITNFRLGRVQRQVDKGKLTASQGSLLAGNIMEQYHDKNQQYLNKAKQELGRPITVPPTTGSGLNSLNSNRSTSSRVSNNQTKPGQGVSILQNLKNTWEGMSDTQKNVARIGAGALAIGSTVAITNAIKNRQRRKAEEEARRSGRRGGVIVF